MGFSLTPLRISNAVETLSLLVSWLKGGERLVNCQNNTSRLYMSDFLVKLYGIFGSGALGSI